MNAPIRPARLRPADLALGSQTPNAPTPGSRPRLRLRILGIRGVPAAHGGFETFAERLSMHLVSQGWEVFVYCQHQGEGEIREDEWHGVHRVIVPSGAGSLGSIRFDWRSIRHAAGRGDLCLTLGYNTAIFCWRLRLAGVPNVINMDGIEWARGKWGPLSKLWFYLNDWAGCWLADYLVADHPEILKHLASRGVQAKTTMIPYAAHELCNVNPAPLERYGLESGRYFLTIARPEPENSILEIVAGYSNRARDWPLVLLGNFDDRNRYHREVKKAAGPGVRFLGAIYDPCIVHALRRHATAYLHGHRVGGTNPSLVEALGAGNAVIAHDNRFNRWVAGPDALYFGSPEQCADCLDRVVCDTELLARMRAGSVRRFNEQFTFEAVHSKYEALLGSLVRT